MSVKNEGFLHLEFSMISSLNDSYRTIISVYGCDPSERTKQGLVAARASGQCLGRPKGAKNKTRVLDPFKDEIKKYLELKLAQTNILKIVNSFLEKPISLTALRYFIQNDKILSKI